jgi:hypothetical protein
VNAHALPDDPRDWPSDPFELLGVARSVSESDLKRAYTRLIRKYKPEHAPDEFRRIREAYEAAVEMSRWYRDAPPVRDIFRDLPFSTVPTAPADPSADPSAPTPEAAPRESKPDEPHETQVDPQVRPVAVDPVEAAWADAIAGHWGDAYSVLALLADQHPNRADLPLRLYWLLALRPTLDDDRTRHDWLAAALIRARLRGPAVELYRRELDTDPQTALYGPYAHLLEVPGASGHDLLAVASARLVVAGTDERWARLELDLSVLECRAADFEESAWLIYLADLAGRAADQHLGLLCRCRELMAPLRHLELSHAWVFDRLDEQTLLAERLNALKVVPEPIRRAVAASVRSSAASQKALEEVIGWAANDPEETLSTYDVLSRNRQHKDVLAALTQFVEARRDRTARIDYPTALVRGAARAFLADKQLAGTDRTGRQAYLRLRPALLRFLLAERIDPEELVGACFVDPHPDTRTLVHHVRADDVLSAVYRLASA